MRAATALALGILPAVLACSGDAIRSPDPAERVAAVEAAARKGDGGTPALLLAQRDADPRVRRAVAEAFAARDGPAAVDALASFLVDPDPEVVGVAARSLAARPSVVRTRDALVAAYPNASPAGRAAVADALDSVGTSLREAVELEARTLWERNLAALAVRGPARAGAAEEIGASARAEAVVKLVPLLDLARNPDRDLAAAAARGLGEAGDWSARRQLEGLLAAGDAELAEAAADALGRLGDPGAAEALADAARGAGRTAGAAVEALALLPQAPEVGATLCEVALRSVAPQVAALAARSVRERDADCPARPLLARLGGPGTVAALAALAELRPPEAEVAPKVIPLLDPARNPEGEVRLAALRVVGGLKLPAAAAAVRERLVAQAARLAAARARWLSGSLPAEGLAGLEKGGEGRLAAVVARAAGAASGASAAEPALAPLVPVPRAQLVELGALLAEAGRLRVAGAEALLVPFAADPDPAVRAGALTGLGALGGEASLAPASAAVGDAAPEVRQAAASALRRLGPRGAAVLSQALQDPALPADCCAALAAALGETGLPDAVPALGARLGGPCGAVAAQALGGLQPRARSLPWWRPSIGPRRPAGWRWSRPWRRSAAPAPRPPWPAS